MDGSLVGLLAEARPDRVAIVVPDGPSLTYAELRVEIAMLAETLATAGIQRTDRVAIALPNGAEAIVAVLAASLVGVAAPLNPALAEDEFRFSLRDVAAKALIVAPDGGERARRARPSDTLVAEYRLDAGRRARLRGAVPFGARRTPVAPAPADAAIVLHSSGTTGRPKRVALRNDQLVASIGQIVNGYRLGPDDVGLAVMPLFHVHGIVAGALATLAAGGTIVVPARFNGLGFGRLVREHRVSWYSAVPTIHQLVLARARSDAGGCSSLRFVRSASATLPATVHDALAAALGVPVIEAYGMTEAAHQIASNPLDPARSKRGTVGQGTGVRIATMDEHGRPLPPGREGEVALRGQSVITHYDGDPAADAATFTDGWFRTGDLGVLDDNGYLTLVGRLKELINRGGEKIAPAEIDEVMLAHPAVAEAVCFGVPHPLWGEEIEVAVVLRADASAEELIRHCRAHVAAFKVPKRVHLVDAIPRTASGKIQRIAVARQLQAA